MGPGTKCGLCLSAWQPLIPQLLPRIIETFANAAELPAAPGLPPVCEPPALLVPPASAEPAVPPTHPPVPAPDVPPAPELMLTPPMPALVIEPPKETDPATLATPPAPGLPPSPPAFAAPPTASIPALWGRPLSFALTPASVPEHAMKPRTGASNPNLANEM